MAIRSIYILRLPFKVVVFLVSGVVRHFHAHILHTLKGLTRNDRLTTFYYSRLLHVTLAG